MLNFKQATDLSIGRFFSDQIGIPGGEGSRKMPKGERRQKRDRVAEEKGGRRQNRAEFRHRKLVSRDNAIDPFTSDEF